MAMVKVKATRLGYYNHLRQREGTVFMMDEADMNKDKNGKFVLPSWVTLANKKVKAEPEPDTSHIVDNGEVI